MMVRHSGEKIWCTDGWIYRRSIC